MSCLYPHNAGTTAYGKGCRCDRCRAAKAASMPNRGSASRWRGKFGVWTPSLRPTPVEIERFWSKVNKTDRCWIWMAHRDKCGYGQVSIGQRLGEYNNFRAHRLAYELIVGPIPDGLTLDHLCLNTACVNPVHLEPVTRAENSRRSSLLRVPPPPKPIRHGTHAGYAMHRYRGHTPCDDCRRANAAYERERKERVA